MPKKAAIEEGQRATEAGSHRRCKQFHVSSNQNDIFFPDAQAQDKFVQQSIGGQYLVPPIQSTYSTRVPLIYRAIYY